MNEKLLEKARAAKSAEELAELAKAEGKELTAEQAAELYARLHPAQGELGDDELDGVAGGEDLESVYGGGCDGSGKFIIGDIVKSDACIGCVPDDSRSSIRSMYRVASVGTRDNGHPGCYQLMCMNCHRRGEEWVPGDKLRYTTVD